MWDNAAVKFQQSILIPRKPSVLALDASGNAGGWEAEMAARICNVMRRQQVEVDGPIAVNGVAQLQEVLLQSHANCLFVIAAGKSDAGPAVLEMLGEMNRNYPERSKVIAIYLTDMTVLATDKLSSAAAALISTPSLTQKEAAMFYPEFFSELANHSPDGISLAMVRFCYAKANRFAPGKVEIRIEA